MAYINNIDPMHIIENDDSLEYLCKVAQTYENCRVEALRLAYCELGEPPDAASLLVEHKIYMRELRKRAEEIWWDIIRLH